jgi:surface antigen/peptidoglycan hydrolase CwlO-like protein
MGKVMKLRSATPASVSLTTRILLGFIGVLFVVATPIQITQRVFADHYDDQINALQQEINSYNAQASQLDQQAKTLQSAVDQLQAQASAIQAQVDLSQTKYDQLVSQIADTEKQIKDNQDALGVTIANMYVDDKVTPIEMLASSKTISDYLDKQEYQSSIRDQLTSTINKIKDLKTQLVKQQVAIKSVLDEQKAQKLALVSKESDQQNLLNQTQGQESAYQNMISQNQAKINSVRAEQALTAARYSGSGGYVLVSSGLLGSYPWDSSNCPMWGYLSTGGADGNGSDGHGYGCRQCASYVAWKIAKETGRYYSWGNAVNFTQSAINAGYAAGGPQAGSIAVMDPGTAGASEGHVAWVEAVNGGSVLISQYNYNYGAGYGMYSEMWLSAGAFDHYVHIL